MKKYYIFLQSSLMFFASMILFSCNKDYVEPDDDVQMRWFGVVDGITDGAGSPNINPSYVTTRELFGLMDISFGEESHEWHLLKYDENTKEWGNINDFDLQFIRTNSGIPSTILEDFDPEEYTEKEPVKSPTTRKSILAYYDVPGKYNLKVRDKFIEPIQYFFSILDSVTGQKETAYFSSVPTDDGLHLVERDFFFEVYMKLEGACNIYTDVEKKNPIDFDFRSQENIIYEVKKGTTLYYDEISGETEYDKVDYRKWVAEYYKINPNDEIATSLPVISDPSAKSVSITFNEIGAFRIVLQQRYDEPSGLINTSFPKELENSPIPLIIKVVP